MRKTKKSEGERKGTGKGKGAVANSYQRRERAAGVKE